MLKYIVVSSVMLANAAAAQDLQPAYDRNIGDHIITYSIDGNEIARRPLARVFVFSTETPPPAPQEAIKIIQTTNNTLPCFYYPPNIYYCY